MQDNINNGVNQRIARYRKLSEMTQAQVADAIGLKRNTYARMEKYGTPSPEILKKLAKLFNVSVAMIVIGTEENPYAPPPEKKLVFKQPSFLDVLPMSEREIKAIQMFRRLDEEDKNKIIEIFDKFYDENANKE